MREPQLVLTPRVQKMSLCAKGKPVSGPRCAIRQGEVSGSRANQG